jgi:hypothetical protein
MNHKIFNHLVLIIGGLGGIGISLFAYQVGLDNDPGWGPRRFLIMGAGFALVFIGTSLWIVPKLTRWWVDINNYLNKISVIQFVNNLGQQVWSWFREFTRLVLNSALIQNIKRNKLYGWLSRNRVNVGLTLLGVFLAGLYIWVITIGRIEKWPSGRDYYWLLAQAFRQGHTYLPVEPNPDLMKLENPYDHHQRKGLEYLWDTTLYNGKYYLYWGPAPAVLGAIVSSITSKPVTDAGLVFSFVIGTALFSVLLLREIYREFKPVGWVFWGGVLASTVNIPLIWLLTRPTFYEVSISGGQFFLMAGFFLLFSAFRSPVPHKGLLAFSALALGLAGATRINLLPSVVFLALAILWRIYVTNKKRLGVSLPAFVSVLLPLSLVAASLLWYNHARFGSIFEFGHRYQLTGPSLPADYNDIRSVSYIIPNSYTYLFRLPSLSGEFPFLTVPWVKENMWPSFIRLPAHYYYTEPVAGILFIVPLVGLTGLLLVRIFWLLINGDLTNPESARNNDAGLFSWIGFTLSVYVLIQMFILLIFINSAIRYLFDISPELILLSTIFVGSNLHKIAAKSYQVKVLSFLWILASILTVVSGFLIGFTGEKNNFLNQNPQLYYQLHQWFSR